MLVNCVLRGNEAKYGGGLYVDGGDPTIVNCTISGNDADRSGGGIYVADGSPAITNCIFWANTDDGRGDDSTQIGLAAGTPVVTYTCVQDVDPDDAVVYPGTGNLDDDPLFVDAGGGDVRLSAGSPCLDAGNNNAPGLPATDHAGDPRISNATVDSGAYETQAPPPAPAVSAWGLSLMPLAIAATGAILISRRRRSANRRLAM